MNDDEYANFISEAFMSPEVKVLMSHPSIDIDELMEDVRRRFNLSIKREVFEKVDGPFSEVGLSPVIHIAKEIAKKTYTKADEIVVKFVPNWAINGQIIINPSTNNPIILINLGLTGTLQFALNCYLAIVSKNKSANLTAINFTDLYDEILEVAEVSVNCEVNKFKTNIVKQGGLDSNFNIGVINLTVMIEIFIVLHELAHIALGHVFEIDTAPPDDLTTDAHALHLIDRTIEKEIAADFLALKWLTNPESGSSMSESDALFIIGFYLLYSELCHSVDSRDFSNGQFQYAEYLHRWESVKLSLQIERFQGSSAWELDAWFSRIKTHLFSKKHR